MPYQCLIYYIYAVIIFKTSVTLGNLNIGPNSCKALFLNYPIAVVLSLCSL